MWRWIFLDVGNVLLDEDPLTCLSLRRHAEAVARVRPDVGFLDLLALREARATAGSRWPVYEAVSEFLDDTQCAQIWDATTREVHARFDELSPVIPGANALLDALAGRFRLGLIANQGAPCRARLAALGWLNRFDVVALSEEVGFAKPDPRLFQHALVLANAEPRDCLMVGDRADNDLLPAAALGLSSAWIRWPDRAAKGWRPDEPEERAYLASLERACAAADARLVDLRPTLIANGLQSLAAQLALGFSAR